MRIISSFHDYYDSLQTKTDPLYIRKTTEEEFKLKERTISWKDKGGGSDRVCLSATIVGFCGEIFLTYISRGIYLFSPEEIQEKYPIFTDTNLKYQYQFGYHYIGFGLPDSFLSHFKHLFNPQCPIWFVHLDNQKYNGVVNFEPRFSHYHTLVRNPCLKKTNFVNRYGVAQTFQKIEMYLSNLAFPNKPIPKISDEDMIMAKGFDKHSFRKDKKK